VAAFEADPGAVYGFTGRFFNALRAAGVAHAVVSPGSRSTPLAITARSTPGLRTWVELDERAAAFFALGLAKASGRPALLVCTSGTAAANYLPAVIEAHYARVPMILATSDRPAERRDWGAGQTIEQVGLYGRYARWAAEVPIPEVGEDAARFASQLAARAVEEASATPAGAVHLNWPFREPLAPPVGALSSLLESGSEAPAGPAFAHAQSFAASEDVAALADCARTQERGVICAGPMDASPALRSAVVSFAEASGWPVLADPASNLRAGPLAGSAGVLDAGDLLTRAPVWSAAHRPEVVIRLGETPISKAQRIWLEDAEPETVWWLDEGGSWGEPSHRATRVLRGVAASLLAGAATELERVSRSAPLRERVWFRDFEAANSVARVVVGRRVEGGEGLCGLSVASAVARLAPSDSQLFAANSMSVRLLDLAFTNRASPLRVLVSRGASGIDGLTSTALGSAAAAGTPTLLLTGDLAFLHDLSGLLLAKRESIPLTIVVLDDDGGGIFSMLPVARQGEEVHFEELFRTPHGLDLSRVAPLFDLDAHRVSDRTSLEVALGQALSTPGVSIIHAPVDPGTNEASFRAALAAGREAIDALGSA